MKGSIIFANPPSFRTFQLAHRMEKGEHFFEVAYGSSFNELYYDFTPEQFLITPDREELLLQFRRAGIEWLIPILDALADKTVIYSTEELRAVATKLSDQ